MKTKLLLIIISVLSIISCDKKDDNKEPYPLTFEKESYELPLNLTTSIMIRSGNRDYTLSVEDPSILDAKIDLSSAKGMGDIRIKAKKKGETTLSVTDNVVKETVKLTIKIAGAHMALMIIDSNHPALTDKILIDLNNDENRALTFISEENSSSEIVAKGRYEFSVEKIEGENIQCLTLHYASDESGRFTDAAAGDASIAPTAHKFDISGNPQEAYGALALFFNLNWDEMTLKEVEPRAIEVSPIKLEMREIGTEYKISCILNFTRFRN